MRIRKKTRIIALMLVFAIFVCSCSSNSQSDSITNDSKTNTEIESSSNSGSATTDAEKNQIEDKVKENAVKQDSDEKKSNVQDSNNQVTKSEPVLTEEEKIIKQYGLEVYSKAAVTSVTDKAYTYNGKSGLYSGDWKGDRPEGKGRLAINEHEYYDGEWSCGNLLGQAEYLSFSDTGIATYYSGKCSSEYPTGEGIMQVWNRNNFTGWTEIRGDFTDESTLWYCSYDENEFLTDIGVFNDGEYYSYVNNPDVVSNMSKAQVWLRGSSSGSYWGKSGKYFGMLNEEGNPNGPGYFIEFSYESYIEALTDTGIEQVPSFEVHAYLSDWKDGYCNDKYVELKYDTLGSVVDLDRVYQTKYGYSGSYMKEYYYICNENGDPIEYTSYEEDSYRLCIGKHYVQDYQLYNDNIYRAGLVSYDTYYKQESGHKNSWGQYIVDFPAGGYAHKEYYPAYYLKNNTKKTFDDGYLAVYDSSGELYSYYEFNTKYPEGHNTMAKPNLLDTILTVGTVLLVGYAGYKFIASSKKESIKDKNWADEYSKQKKDESEAAYKKREDQYNEYKKLMQEADALEDIYHGTYSEWEVMDRQQRAKEKRDEAMRMRPDWSLFW